MILDELSYISLSQVVKLDYTGTVSDSMGLYVTVIEQFGAGGFRNGKTKDFTG